MTAPTPTARLAPNGTKMDDPFPTTVCFAADPDVAFWEKSVKPPGVDGGDGIDTTTMFNEVYHTKASRVLKMLSNAGGKAAYDPAVLPMIVALINVETSITVHFPSGKTWTFYGYLKSFTPSENSFNGGQPEADFDIVVTNCDPTSRAEEAPVYAAAVGTGTGV